MVNQVIDMQPNEEMLSVLQQIRNDQQALLDGQKESLKLQREQFEMARIQFERAEKLQDRAEQLQDRGSHMMQTARRVLAVILPIVIALVIYLSWLIFR
jgi:uncharacterized membrane protein (DUF106 family)